MKFPILILFFLSPLALLGHPSWGILIDQSGNILFSDLEHVWQISPDGKLTKRLPDVHTHNLFLDQNGSLFGSDSKYYEPRDEWTNRLWKLNKEGELEDVIPWVKDFESFGGTNFSITGEGAIIFPFENQLFRRTESGNIQPFSDFTFGRLCTMVPDQNGGVLVSDSSDDGKLYRVDSSGQVQLIAQGLKEQQPKNPPLKEARFNLFYGITVQDDQIFVSNSGSRRILQIESDGSFKEYFKSDPPWYPVGIYFHKEGVYILEWGFRLRNLGPRILRKNKAGEFAEIYNHKTRQVNLSLNPSPSGQAFPFKCLGLLAFLVICLLYFKLKKS